MPRSKVKPAVTEPAATGSESRPLQTVGDAITDQLATHIRSVIGSPEPAPEPEVTEGAPDPGAPPGSAAPETPAPETPEPDEAEPEPDESGGAEQTTDVPDLYQEAAPAAAVNDSEESEPEPGAEPVEDRVPLKRLHKEVARRKALEAELAAERAKQRAVVPPADPAAPFIEQFADVRQARESEAQAAEQLARAKSLLRQVAIEPDKVRARLEKDHGFDSSALDDTALQQRLEDARDTFQSAHIEAVSRREALLERRRGQIEAQRAQTDAQAATLYPWQRDPKSAEWAEAQSILAAYPQLKDRPDRGIVLGRLVTGVMHERQLAKAGAPAPAPRPHPPKIPAPKAAPRQVVPGVRSSESLTALRQAASSGNREAMAEALARGLI